MLKYRLRGNVRIKETRTLTTNDKKTRGDKEGEGRREWKEVERKREKEEFQS